MERAPLRFELKGVRKAFGVVPVLKGVDLALHQGEVLGFLGANGAGKSTLMKIIAGIQSPDEGVMTLDGQLHAPATPSQAIQAGVGIVHQELSLVGGLSIVDNLFLGRELHHFGVIRTRDQKHRAREALSRVGCLLEPDRRVDSLRTGEKQLVEIARSLMLSCKLLILDEPTAALSPAESERLFRLIRELSRQGIGIIYISHRLEEIDALADRVVVLRDGQVVYNEPRGVYNRSSIVQAMAGREVGNDPVASPPPSTTDAAPLLSARQLNRSPLIKQVSLDLFPGSLVALTGLIGSGRTELLRLLAGFDQPDGGNLSWSGDINRRGESPGELVGFLPEDRKEQGLFLDHPALWNLSLGVLPRLRQQGVAGFRLGRPRSWLGSIPAVAERSLFSRLGESMGLHPARPDWKAGRYSGGNQQKILLGRILAGEPRILLLDEPTRGVDVASRADIYRILRQCAHQGAAVLFATSEFEEALTLGERILVMREGRISADLTNHPGLTAADLMHHAVPEGQ